MISCLSHKLASLRGLRFVIASIAKQSLHFTTYSHKIASSCLPARPVRSGGLAMTVVVSFQGLRFVIAIRQGGEAISNDPITSTQVADYHMPMVL